MRGLIISQQVISCITQIEQMAQRNLEFVIYRMFILIVGWSDEPHNFLIRLYLAYDSTEINNALFGYVF